MKHKAESPYELVKALYDVLENFDVEGFANSPAPDETPNIPKIYAMGGDRSFRRLEQKTQIIKTIKKLAKLCRDFIAESEPLI